MFDAISVMRSIGIGVICGLILSMLYVAVKHQWPQNYFHLDSTADPVVSRNMPRYLIFRFAPPMLGFGAAAVTADRLGDSPWIASLTAVSVHCLGLVATICKALYRRQRYKLAVARTVVVLTLIGLSILSVSLRKVLAPIIPTPRDLLSNFWAGAIAAIAAVFLQRIALIKRDPLSIALACTRKIDSAIFQYANTAAKAAGVDPRIVFYFMIAEDIQRPRWYRGLEAGMPGHRGRTTGIMQQIGARSDFESIDIAIRNYFEPATKRVDDLRLDDDDEAANQILSECLQQYNEDPVFHELVRGLADNLPGDEEWLQVIRTKIRPTKS